MSQLIQYIISYQYYVYIHIYLFYTHGSVSVSSRPSMQLAYYSWYSTEPISQTEDMPSVLVRAWVHDLSGSLFATANKVINKKMFLVAHLWQWHDFNFWFKCFLTYLGGVYYSDQPQQEIATQACEYGQTHITWRTRSCWYNDRLGGKALKYT